MNTEQSQEMWQVESGGEVFDTTFAEMTTWIDEGSLLKIDRVRKGNLRWIEAGKVPSLLAVFNAKEAGEPVAPPVVTLTKLGPTVVQGSTVGNPPNLTASPLNRAVTPTAQATRPAEPMCSVHDDVPAVYVCETCSSPFCKTCPNSYGGTVKVCPFCGAMCSKLSEAVAVQAQEAMRSDDIGQGFGFADFGRALVYPFKFKTSLVMGAIMYAFVSIGRGATGFGGIFMLGGALACFAIGNTLTFGVLSNTVEKFSQGKIGDNFMPTFEDFSIWDDVFQPFFLSIGVYVISFGPLIAVGLMAFFLIVSPAAKQMNGFQSDAARTVNPELPYAANAAQQSEKIRELLKKTSDDQKRRVASLQDREAIVENRTRTAEDDLNDEEIQPDVSRPAVTGGDPDEEFYNRTQKMIAENRKAQLEMAVGKTPETQASEQAAMIKQILGYGLLFVFLGGLCLLWGLFYFPAACTVAGYTQSFAATLNPSVGFDTIKHLGWDYLKILVMCLCIGILSLIVGGVSNLIFSDFDMPTVGNLPAKVIQSIFGFYLSVVFACTLGFALYKNADKLKLCR